MQNVEKERNVDYDFFDEEYQLLINGEWTNGTEGKRMSSINPSTGEKLATFIDASDADVDAAVEAAQDAFTDWKKTSAQDRSNLLLEIADKIEENLSDFALMETLDNGKPYRETSQADIPLAVDHFRYFAGAIRAEEGSSNAMDEESLSIIIREPFGVVGQIIPWNFPFLMAAWKLAPALAAGNTVVIHPSSTTSLTLLELGKIIQEVLPAGVVNIITGKGSKSGEYMQHHKGFKKLAFTGSTEIGREVGISAAKNLIPATLELGGKSANIFFDDMSIDRALEGAQMGILFNQGEVCSAGSRIFVQEGIYDQFIGALKKEFEQVKVGLPWDDETQMGALTSQSQIDKVTEYVEIGRNEGANVLTGGSIIHTEELENGFFMQPTLIEGTNDMRIAQEEIFGPVAVVIKFKDEKEVIDLANDSIYGLAGGVWTRDINKAIRVSRNVETGRIWVNCYNEFPAGSPFGGYKQSGIGRETHKVALDAYSQMKNIHINMHEGRNGMF